MKRVCQFLFCSTLALVLPVPAAITNSVPHKGNVLHVSATPTNTWTEVSLAEMDARALKSNKAANELLEDDPDKWRQGQAQHYVVHFFANEGDLFARKVAAMADFFYDYISQDLGFVNDHFPFRSHIFTFRNEYRWKKFLKTQPTTEQWAYSYVSGACMFLQQAKNTKDSTETLAHENTHLVVNHFIKGSLPVWLNEGTAEYYGEFGLSAFRGLTRHSGTVFRGLRDPLPLTRLFKITDKYPEDRKEVDKLYKTAKYFAGFLMTKKPHEKFHDFLTAMAQDTDVTDALRKHYGFDDIAAAQKEFTHFCR
ncbi:MAG: hypothetical protein EPN23_01535 [Verrucomicrobia bacterium]|nr:MAG: hypothetical protein EPN23_01535 [Verrucomicrobiota bacterium]